MTRLGGIGVWVVCVVVVDVPQAVWPSSPVVLVSEFSIHAWFRRRYDGSVNVCAVITVMQMSKFLLKFSILIIIKSY